MLVQVALSVPVHLFDVDYKALDCLTLLKELCQRVKLALSQIVWDHQLGTCVAQSRYKLLEIILEALQFELAGIVQPRMLLLKNLYDTCLNRLTENKLPENLRLIMNTCISA